MSNPVPPVATAAVVEPPAPPLSSDGEMLGQPNKYLYGEFAGYEGERLLKSILHKILPLALYRTWEVLVERQAPGNDCFLSIASISETAERVERTIRLNIHEFEARKLMVLRPEQKLLRQPDQSLKLKLVVVKDFSGLYALAREYLRWTQSDSYIEPERDFADAIQADDRLKRKLLRFNNYRRIILNKVPGPKPVEREEHRWYAAYDPGIDEQESGTSGGTAAPIATGRAEDAEEQRTPGSRNLYLQENLQEDLKKDSQERITPNDHTDTLYRVSFDSGEALEGGGSGYTKIPDERTTNEQVRKDSPLPTPHTNSTKPSSVPSEEAGGANQAGRKERADLDEQAKAFVQRALAASQGSRGEATGRDQHIAPKAKPNSLVSAFVREVSPLFRDQNLKASLTRALRAVEQTHLTQKDILACLVKAYLVTLETKKVREQYRRPDGDIKMPLFVTMFVRFTTDCAAGTFGYTDDHLARDIADDDRLVLFIVEHRLEATLLENREVETTDHREVQQEETPVSVEEDDPSTNCSAPLSAPEEEAHAEEAQLVPSEQPQQPWIDAESPECGWQTYDHALWWADRLREVLGRDQYNYDVCPTQYGRYGFVFFLRSDPANYWVFLTRDEVKQYL